MQQLRVESSAVALYLFRGRGPAARTLLLRRAASPLEGTWQHVAGAIAEGETAQQAARRLTLEQSGVAPRLYSADVCEQFYEPHGERLMLVPVFVGYVDADAGARPGEGFGECAWCSRDEALARLAFPAQRRILATLWGDFVDASPTPWLALDGR